MLKSLEIFGFKSFADRTRFDFHSGITAIVGPNGSGKSNVVDAIKWILGDQSAKSLRGKEMTDVIFNGARGRKSLGMAEATLTFDNSSGFLPSEFQEVQIGRRIMSSGDSEYLINRATARLKDVRELFLGTGAGTSAYAIIEQGRVDQILQSNAANRRQVFEEAAGISRYKARKAEALRKLERVEQNLLRLTDIVDEVEAQLNATRSQAAKAARFRDVSRELKELWLGLAADDHRHLTERLRNMEAELAGFDSDVAELNRQLAEAEERRAALETEMADVEDRLREVEQHRSGNRETIARHDATVRHQTARHRELESELARLRKQASHLAARAGEAVAERRHNADNLAAAEEEFARHRAKLAQREARIREFDDSISQSRATLEERRQRLDEQVERMATETGRVSRLESQQAAAGESEEQARKRMAEIDRHLETCLEENARREALAGKAAELASQADAMLCELRQRRESLLSEHTQFQRTLAELREQRSASQARKSVLEDLEDRQEGLGIGVKEILSRSKTSDYPPWNGILGSAADLISVDLEYAALLEVAIGERSQLIVVNEYGPLVEYLSHGDYRIAGRVGFVVPHPEGAEPEHRQADNTGTGTLLQSASPPAGSPEPGSLEQVTGPAKEAAARFSHFVIDEGQRPDLSHHECVVSRADRLVRSVPRAAGLAARLLSDTWIVDTLDDALALSAGEGRGCRFVTRLGELLESDGTLVVGSVRAESAIVSRKSELRRLKRDLQQLERKIAREEKRLAGLDHSLAEADGELVQAETAHREAAKALSACEAELSEQQREIARQQGDRETLLAEADRSAARQRQIQHELEQARLAVAEGDDEVRTLETGIAEAERQVARRSHRRQTLEQRLATEQLDLAKSEERLHGMRDAVARLDRDLSQRQQQREEAERRLQLVAEKASQITLHILNTNAAQTELLLLDEGSADKAAVLLREKKRLRDVRARNQKQIDAVRQQRRDRSDARHQQEIQLRDIRRQIETFAERIEEEYQVRLEDVVAAGKSAYAAYLEERRAERGELNHSGSPDAAADQTSEDESSEEQNSGDRKSAGWKPGFLEKLGFTASGGAADEQQPAADDETAADEGLPSFEEVRDELESRVNRLRRKLKLMGSVNTESLHDLDELEERHTRLAEQLADLVEARNALDEIIRRISVESQRMFAETFASIRGHFQELFRKLFGGGEADIVLEDADDVLECGIDVVARPPGKELRSISLLSGGERTMTAVGLLLAIFKSKPSPFCILDEVDAALDEANLGRFVGLLKEFRASTQFIMITHRKPSMTQADVLYGVTMEQSGVSKRMNVRFDDVSDDGSFRTSALDAPVPPSAQSGEQNAAA